MHEKLGYLYQTISVEMHLLPDLEKKIVNSEIMGIQIWRKKRVNYNKFEVVTKQHKRIFKFLVTIKTHCVEKILPPFTFCFPYFC